MKVRMLRRITGLRDGVEWPEIGDEIDLPEWEANGLQISGVVEIVETRAASDVGDSIAAVDVAGPAGETVTPAGPSTSSKRRKA